MPATPPIFMGRSSIRSDLAEQVQQDDEFLIFDLGQTGRTIRRFRCS